MTLTLAVWRVARAIQLPKSADKPVFVGTGSTMKADSLYTIATGNTMKRLQRQAAKIGVIDWRNSFLTSPTGRSAVVQQMLRMGAISFVGRQLELTTIKFLILTAAQVFRDTENIPVVNPDQSLIKQGVDICT